MACFQRSRMAEIHVYTPRNGMKLSNVIYKTNLLSSPFLEFLIPDFKHSPMICFILHSYSPLKFSLYKNDKTVSQFSDVGDRKTIVIHARRRMHCSRLEERLRLIKTFWIAHSDIFDELPVKKCHYIFKWYCLNWEMFPTRPTQSYFRQSKLL